MFHVKQNTEKTQIKVCPLCSSEDIMHYGKTKDYFFTQEEFSITKCQQCYFVFTNPVPKNLSAYYNTPEYLSHNTKNGGIISKVYSFLRFINIKRKYNLISLYCKKGNILDIGSGTGELLSYFNKNGWDTTGIEPNENARKFSKINYNIEVYNENKLDDFGLKSFDVITMWHVLEHVPDLHKRLSQISKIIKDNGTLVFALPNLNSPDSIKYKGYWSALDVPRHLHHFTQQSFEKLISYHNLRLVHAEPMKFDSYYVSMLSEKYMKNKFYYFSAIYNGFISNMKAKKNNNYSSMIFVVKKDI